MTDQPLALTVEQGLHVEQELLAAVCVFFLAGGLFLLAARTLRADYHIAGADR